MKMRWAFAALFALCSMLASSPAKAADPTKIKVGILLPLTGPFAAVAETETGRAAGDRRHQQKGRSQHALGQGDGGRRRRRRRSQFDVGVRRYRYMVSEGVKGVGGQTWAPLAYALNAIVSKEPMPLPDLRDGQGSFPKGQACRFQLRRSLQPVDGRLYGRKSAVQTLGKKRVFFLARTDSWGWDMRDGAYAAAKEFGAEIVGYEETALGTNESTTTSCRRSGPQSRTF